MLYATHPPLPTASKKDRVYKPGKTRDPGFIYAAMKKSLSLLGKDPGVAFWQGNTHTLIFKLGQQTHGFPGREFYPGL